MEPPGIFLSQTLTPPVTLFVNAAFRAEATVSFSEVIRLHVIIPVVKPALMTSVPGFSVAPDREQDSGDPTDEHPEK